MTGKLRAVQDGLAQAPDAQIARVVAMVDAMAQRGGADALIAPLRPRLAQLRPARPFGFVRLLFTPLDPLVVPARGWQRGRLQVPRTAIAPLGQALRAALPDQALAMEARAAELALDDQDAAGELGRPLWPAAATALATLGVPLGWADATGLPERDFSTVIAVVRPVLQAAAGIHLLAAASRPLPDAAIRAVLAAAAAQGPPALGAVVAVLLARLPVPDRVAVLAAELAGGGQPRATDQAIDHALAGATASLDAAGGDAMHAALEAARVANLLNGLETASGTFGERRVRIEQIRRDADLLCRGRFDQALAGGLGRQLGSLPASPGDAEIVALESGARDLRRLEAAGRRLGGGEHYDRRMRELVAPLRLAGSGLGLADRVRLIEILAGPDEALSVLETDAPRASHPAPQSPSG